MTTGPERGRRTRFPARPRGVEVVPCLCRAEQSGFHPSPTCSSEDTSFAELQAVVVSLGLSEDTDVLDKGEMFTATLCSYMGTLRGLSCL